MRKTQEKKTHSSGVLHYNASNLHFHTYTHTRAHARTLEIEWYTKNLLLYHNSVYIYIEIQINSSFTEIRPVVFNYNQISTHTYIHILSFVILS